MHSLIEIGQVVLDKKRPLNTICKYYFIISVLLPPAPLVKNIGLHLNKLKGVAIWTRKLTNSLISCLAHTVLINSEYQQPFI